MQISWKKFQRITIVNSTPSTMRLHCFKSKTSPAPDSRSKTKGKRRPATTTAAAAAVENDNANITTQSNHTSISHDSSSHDRITEEKGDIDIFSDDFFADDSVASVKVVDYVSENLKLQAIEESVSHTAPSPVKNIVEDRQQGNNHDSDSDSDSDSDIYLDEEEGVQAIEEKRESISMKSDEEEGSHDTSADLGENKKANQVCHKSYHPSKEGEHADAEIPPYHCGENHNDDSRTNTTCRSTDNENHSSQSSSLQDDRDVSNRDLNLEEAEVASVNHSKAIFVNSEDNAKECSNSACLLLRQTVRQQEEQICFLRRKLQEYADICKLHDIGHDILGDTSSQVPGYDITTHKEAETVDSIDLPAKTVYEETTYKDMMGPWDIPFHVELLEPKGSFGEYSGITFAQHPSKVDTTDARRLRPCPTDDDDALPVVRTSHYYHSNKNDDKPTAARTTVPPEEANRVTQSTKPLRAHTSTTSTTSTSPLAVERLMKRIYAPTKHVSPIKPIPINDAPASIPTEHPGSPMNAKGWHPGVSMNAKKGTRQDSHTDDDVEKHVMAMPVVLERKYGRQQALFSGTVHPTSGCPHGSGSFQFIKSGDVYIGDVAYGEMHGRGTYCHRKSNKLFRGDFSRNSFVGLEL